jgi:hypothetical protein
MAIVHGVACPERSSRFALCLALSLFAQCLVHRQVIAQAQTFPLHEAHQASTGPEQRSDMFGGLIKLDVTVTDKEGKAVSGLTRSDFTLLDNGQPVDILSFRGFRRGHRRV